MNPNFTDIIYIDWNLLSILKKPELEPHRILSKFLTENRAKLLLAYSDAHLGDLNQTSNEAEFKLVDLTRLSKLTDDLLIVQYFGCEKIEIDFRDPVEFYNDIKSSSNITPLQGGLSNFIDKSYWKLRDEIIIKHFKKDPKEIFNFSLSQLDELIRLTGLCGSLNELIEFGLSLRNQSNSASLSYIDYYTTAYINLDLIGYCPDNMDENGGFNNLLNDSKHSAYGSLCKAFITNDNKCYHKSKLLFEYFKSNSKLIKTCRINQDKIVLLENELISLV